MEIQQFLAQNRSFLTILAIWKKKPTPLKNCPDNLKIAAETKITFGWLRTRYFQKMMSKIGQSPFFKAILVHICVLDFAAKFQNCCFVVFFFKHHKIKI